MKQNMTVIKNKLVKAIRDVGLSATVVGQLEGAPSTYVMFYLETDDSHLKFNKKIKDIEFKSGFLGIEFRPNIIKRRIEVSIPVGNSHYANIDPVAKDFEVTLGVSNMLSETQTIKVPGPGYTTHTYAAHISVTHNFRTDPHLLVAGTTGSGKTSFVHSVISQLISMKEPIGIIPIDFKGTDLSMYTPFLPKGFGTIQDINEALAAITLLVEVMNDRYKQFGADADIYSYNYTNPTTKLQHLFLVIDEFADMMLTSKVFSEQINTLLVRLAQKGRSAGIHLIIATQRPTVDVLSGSIKANITGRVALGAATALESRIIIDEDGAEKLYRGSFIYKLGKCVLGKVLYVSVPAIKAQIAKTTIVVPIVALNTSKLTLDTYVEEQAKQLLSGTPAWNAVRVALRRLPPKVSVYYVIQWMACNYHMSFDQLQLPVRYALDYLEFKGLITTHLNHGTESRLVTEKFFKSWMITNLEYEDPNIKPINIADCFQSKKSENDIWDVEQEKEISQMLRTTSLDDRLDMLKRAIENARKQ